MNTVNRVAVYYHPTRTGWAVTAVNVDDFTQIVHRREFTDESTARSWAKQVGPEFMDENASVVMTDFDPMDV